MENISLTEEEKKELEKRGFLVISENSFQGYIQAFIKVLTIYVMISAYGVTIFIGLTGIIHSFTVSQEIEKTILAYIFIPIVICISALIASREWTKLIFHGKIFLYGKNQSYKVLGGDLRRMSSFVVKERPTKVTSEFFGNYLAFFIVYFLILAYAFPKFVLLFLVSIISIVGVIQFLIQIFHLLYAFGNIGMKIQELTPEIERESKLIQSEFQKEQNFSVLRSGFEKLSGTFSRIVELVVRLEKVESRANKGNLFDSAKYIESLRADIITPLSELKQFLEEQRDSLLDSQKELSRVRVGGGDDSLGANGAFSSKRSDILLAELDESIGKIGGMITKLR